MTSSLVNTLLAIADLFERDSARAFAGTSLTQSRVAVLWTLHGVGPSPQHVIADALGITPRSVSALVDALEASGHVLRAAHPSDRRAFMVELTPVGSALMATMAREHASLEATLLAAVPSDDLPALERGVHAIARRLEELVAAAAQDDSTDEEQDR